MSEPETIAGQALWKSLLESDGIAEGSEIDLGSVIAQVEDEAWDEGMEAGAKARDIDLQPRITALREALSWAVYVLDEVVTHSENPVYDHMLEKAHALL